MEEASVAAYWSANPCGDDQFGNRHVGGSSFFSNYDKRRYTKEAHILRCLDEIDFSNKRVLEIGPGQGAESEQIIRRGGRWSGIDLTKESCDRIRTRLSARRLPYDRIETGSVLRLPFDDNAFDLVFAHGVLHHVPEVCRAQEEIARVLTNDGQLIIMVYAKISLNYLLSISLLRRLGLLVLYVFRIRPGGIYDDHLANAETEGLFRYLKMENFIHRNTDGPFNPYSKVYTKKEIEADFPLFTLTRCHKEHMHAPPLPVQNLPGSHLLGWHLWAHMTPK